jgi:predicted metal-binding protein
MTLIYRPPFIQCTELFGRIYALLLFPGPCYLSGNKKLGNPLEVTVIYFKAVGVKILVA